MKVEIISGQDKIREVIGSISTRAGAYKAVVSSSILSSVQHYRAHGDFTLLQEAMDTVFSVNYRDYSAVIAFLQSLTHVGLTMENKGRRQHYTVIGDLVDAMGERPKDVTQKEWAEKVKRTKENVIKREGMFDNFAQGKETMVKNMDWSVGMDKSLKQVGVVYEGDIFKWHDDVKWLRNDGTGGATTGEGEGSRTTTINPEQLDKMMITFEDRLSKSKNVPAVAAITHLLSRFEADTQVTATPEELAQLETRINIFMTRLKARVDAQQAIAAQKAAEAAQAEGNNPATTGNEEEPSHY